MIRNTRYAFGRTLAMAATVALIAACADAPLAPGRQAAARAEVMEDGGRTMDLGSCDSLQAPEGSTLEYELYAEGVQIYRWTGTSWGPVAPRADLFADAGRTGLVGTHFAGPKWRSMGGSTVAGAVLRRCPSETGAIPWLLLTATPENESGMFGRTTFIQRVNTVGGVAPASPGQVVGEVREEPYTALYRFFRTD
jgi:hypothetical protein